VIYYIALGSNLPERQEHINRAIQVLSALGTVKGKSGLFESDPYGPQQQPPYLNQICILETEIRPFRLLGYLKAAECLLGRKRSYRWGPRLIDLDIIEWNGEEIDSEILKIPHPGFEQRLFVLLPLQEVDVSFTNRQGLTIDRLIGNCPDKGRILLLDKK